MEQRSYMESWCLRAPVLGTILLLGVVSSCAAKVAVGAEDDGARKLAGDRWAVLVGVNKYKHIRPELSYCSADVCALGELLIKAGFDKDRVVIVHDQATDPGLLPTKANIEKQLALTLDSVGPNDFVLLAFSGHGVRLEQQSYLCPFDATMDPADLIAVNSLYQRLQACPARFKLFLVDACQDERSRPKELVATRAEGEVSPLAFGQNETLPSGLLLLTSCSPGQKSVEEPQFGHGVFTHFLLEGLDGQADADHNGSVSLLEWTGYASSKTRAYVRSLDRVQNPSMRGDFPDFELAQNVRLVRAKEAMKKGDAFWKDHNIAEALEQFRLATELAPESAEAHYKLGDCHWRVNDHSSALTEYSRATAVDLECAPALLGRANIAIVNNAVEQAAPDLDRVLRITTRQIEQDPTDPVLFILRARALCLKDVFEGAVKDASEAIRLDPNGAEGYRRRAIALNNLNRFDEAMADCDKAIALDPKYGDVYRIRAHACNGCGLDRANKADWEKAVADASEALRLNPMNVEAYRVRAIALNNLLRFDEAIADCERAIALLPRFDDVYRVRAYAYNGRGLVRQDKADWERAVDDGTHAIRLNAKNVEAYRERGKAYGSLERFDEAIADCTAAIAVDPKDGYLYCLRAYAYSRKGDYDRAIADCDKALEIDPNDAEAKKTKEAAIEAKGTK